VGLWTCVTAVCCWALLKIETSLWDSQQYSEINMNVVRMLSASVLRQIAGDRSLLQYDGASRHVHLLPVGLLLMRRQLSIWPAETLSNFNVWGLYCYGAGMRWCSSCCRTARPAVVSHSQHCVAKGVARRGARVIIIILLPQLTREPSDASGWQRKRYSGWNFPSNSLRPSQLFFAMFELLWTVGQVSFWIIFVKPWDT